MNSIINYYNSGKIKFGISGDRLNKLLPILKTIKNKRVLDVGCASGYLGKILKENGNYVVGIDASSRDIVKAKKVLDEAHVINLETDSLNRFTNQFDFILFSEVIEHLFNPEIVLKKICKCLKSGGQILITTPNMVHIYVRLQFLFGKFVYREETVINRSHIHFFTYNSLKELVESLNLTVIAENSLVFPRTLAGIWKLWPSVFAHTTIILCKKK